MGHALTQLGDLLPQGRKSLAKLFAQGGQFGTSAFHVGL